MNFLYFWLIQKGQLSNWKKLWFLIIAVERESMQGPQETRADLLN